MERKRQKMTHEYIRSQRLDPSLSPLRMVQTVIQDMDELPPYPAEDMQPTAPIYPEIHSIHNTISAKDDLSMSRIVKRQFEDYKYQASVQLTLWKIIKNI